MKIALKELKLALQRVSTGRNIAYKRFFRSMYLAYQLAEEQNLNRLRDKLKGSWQPQKPWRIYTPKSSGLQRPITLLHIEDQIVLQLIANRIADKLYARRKKIEYHVAFSNVLASAKDNVFFLEDWHKAYLIFQKKCEENYRKGFRWIAHFDLAAYYDTISHELLIKTIAPKSHEKEPWKTYKKWLGLWSSPEGVDGHGHGIPQGPIAADFLAEAFLLPMDEMFLKKGVRYVIYVDDIRIFTKTELAAQQAAVELEVYCRNLGLIPQGNKFAIKRAEKLSDALGALPSIQPQDTVPAEEIPQMTIDEAERLFLGSLNKRPLRIDDNSKARYVLFRSPKSKIIMNKVLILLARHPEHIDVFANFLRNYDKSAPLEKTILKIFEQGSPYGYVRGELYHIMARIGTLESLRILQMQAKRDLKDKNACVVLKWGAISLLLSCQKFGICRISSRITKQESIVQALLFPVIPDEEFCEKGILKDLISAKDFMSGLLAPEQLFIRSQTLKDYLLKPKDCHPVIQNILKSLGIVGKRFSPKIDQISDILYRKFGVKESQSWRKLFSDEFTHVLQILIQAEVYYLPAPSIWIQWQNSFNDAVQKALLAYLNSRSLAGAGKITNANSQLIDFGVRLDNNTSFSKTYPSIADVFRDMNKRRNSIPGSHPYEKKTGSQTNYLKTQERNKFAHRLKAAYEEIINIIENNP
ncbi:MAG: RNA-directed DNA polymerase [Proteobacteria bacterium]|nr:RNA-directed DNA polymerase [Pseudomonadota bacterium]